MRKLGVMRGKVSFRGFISGLMIGLLLGSGGVAAAAFGYKGWTTFAYDFRSGYVTGFLDFANLARNLNCGEYVDEKYPYLPQVGIWEWMSTLDQLYGAPENQHYSIASMLQLAAHKLEDKHGGTSGGDNRGLVRLKALLEQHRASKKVEGASGTEGTAEGSASAVKPAPGAGSPVVMKGAPKAAIQPHPRKWCRCDGTDVKAAIAARKLKAQAEERADEEEEAIPQPAPAAPSVPAAPGGK